MKLKAVSGILPALLLIGTLTLVVNVQPISAVESPYIAVVPDSLVDPSLMPGENFTISIGTDYNGSDIWGWQFTLAYNPSVLNGITVTNGDLITNATHPGQAVFLPGNFDNTVGRLSLTGGFFNFTEKPAPITSGPGTLANVTFEVVGTGDSLITIEDQTTLFGWTEGGYGDGYHIIDAYTDPGHIQHGYFDNRFQHDVAVVSVTAPTKATVGELVPISVEVANIGKSSEVVEVAVSYDGVPIETLQVTLLVGESETFLCIWNTTGVAQGSYTLNATATIRPKNETNTWTGDGVTKSFFTTGKPIVPDSEKIYVNQTLMTKPANYTINYEAGKITFATTPGVGAEIKATYLYPVDLFRTDNWKTTTILLVMHDVAVINLDAPANATIGDIVSINVTVANIGAFDEVANVAILYDATYIDSQNVALLVGESKTVSFSWDTTGVAQGTYTVNATAIIPGDGDPTDNWNTTTILFVEQVPVHDVAVISVTPFPNSVRVGELVNITVVVENKGTMPETFDVTVYYDSNTIITGIVTDLVAGASTSLTFTWNTTNTREEIYATAKKEKTYNINATATLALDENPADNTLVSPSKVRVKSQYIAVIPQRTVDTTLTPGNSYTVSIYTDYNGSDVWGYQFSLNYNPLVLHGVEVTNGDLITTDKHPNAMFQAGTFNNTLGKLWQTYAFFYFIEKPIPTTSGPGILANVTFTVVGTGDSNITLSKSETKLFGYNAITDEFYEIVSVSEPYLGHILYGYFRNTVETVTHDVAILSVTPSNTTVPEGDLVNITVVVENQGTVPETITVAAYYDMIHPNWRIAATKTVQNLGAGASTSLTFVWNTMDVTAGSHTIWAEAGTVPGETDTEDNRLQSDEMVTVSPAGVHDIAVVSATAYPTEVTAGEFVTITGTVVNEGDFSEIFSLTVYYDSTMISAYNATLDAGGSTTWAFTWDTTVVPSGTYTIRAEAILDGDADPTDNMLVDGTVTVTSPPAPPMLSIKLSGEHDYLIMENVRIRLAALVKDAATMEPVSDANVTIEIYDSDGVLWVSDVMVEMVASTGIYEWKSEGTIRQLRLAQGVYLVHVQASHQGGPTASDILEFHIDPPTGGTNQTLYHVAFTAVALVGLTGLILKRRKIANRLRKLKRHN